MSEGSGQQAPTRTLGQTAVAAGGWTLFQMIGQNLLRLGSNLIMTRLLVPDAFGLIAFVAALMTGISLVTDIGINRSITRETDGADTHFLRVAWTIKIGRGIVIAVAVLIAAVLANLFAPDALNSDAVFADDRLPGLIALVALVPLMMGLESTCKDLALRHLDIKRIALLTVGAQVCSILAMVGFAQISQTVWALMVGMLVINFVLMIGSHLVFQGPRMGLAWDPEIFWRIWHYGKWLMGSSALNFVATFADRLVLAALLNATSFGLYAIAIIWIEAGRTVLAKLFDQVGFSSWGMVMRDRPDDLPRLHRKFQTIVDTLCILAFLLACLAGPWVVGLLYTDEYHRAGDIIQLLSPLFLSLRFNALSVLLFNTGESRAIMIISAFRAVGLVTLMMLGYWLDGSTGAIVGIAVAPLVGGPYTLIKVRPILGKRILAEGYFWLIGTVIGAGLIYSQVQF